MQSWWQTQAAASGPAGASACRSRRRSKCCPLLHCRAATLQRAGARELSRRQVLTGRARGAALRRCRGRSTRARRGRPAPACDPGRSPEAAPPAPGPLCTEAGRQQSGAVKCRAGEKQGGGEAGGSKADGAEGVWQAAGGSRCCCCKARRGLHMQVARTAGGLAAGLQGGGRAPRGWRARTCPCLPGLLTCAARARGDHPPPAAPAPCSTKQKAGEPLRQEATAAPGEHRGCRAAPATSPPACAASRQKPLPLLSSRQAGCRAWPDSPPPHQRPAAAAASQAGSSASPPSAHLLRSTGRSSRSDSLRACCSLRQQRQQNQQQPEFRTWAEGNSTFLASQASISGGEATATQPAGPLPPQIKEDRSAHRQPGCHLCSLLCDCALQDARNKLPLDVLGGPGDEPRLAALAATQPPRPPAQGRAGQARWVDGWVGRHGQSERHAPHSMRCNACASRKPLPPRPARLCPAPPHNELPACSPVGHCAAALHIHQHPPVLHLAPIRHLVRLLHVVLVLILDEGIAPRLACRGKAGGGTNATCKDGAVAAGACPPLRPHPPTQPSPPTHPPKFLSVHQADALDTPQTHTLPPFEY